MSSSASRQWRRPCTTTEQTTNRIIFFSVGMALSTALLVTPAPLRRNLQGRRFLGRLPSPLPRHERRTPRRQPQGCAGHHCGHRRLLHLETSDSHLWQGFARVVGNGTWSLRHGQLASCMEDLCGEKEIRNEQDWLMEAVIRHDSQPLAVVLLDANLVKLPRNYNHHCRVGPLALAVVSWRIFARR